MSYKTFVGIRKQDGKLKLYFDFPSYNKVYVEPTEENVDRFFATLEHLGEDSYMVSSDLHHPDEFPTIDNKIFDLLAK